MVYTYKDYFKDYYGAVKKAHKQRIESSTNQLAGGKGPTRGKIKTHKPIQRKHFQMHPYGAELGTGWK